MSEDPAQPTESLDWATTGTKTAPSAPKQLQGWVLAEAPPFDNFNWRWDLERQWSEYLNQVAGRQFTTVNGVGGAAENTTPGEKITLLRDGPPRVGDDFTIKGTIGTDVGYQVYALDSDCANLYMAQGDNAGDAIIESYDTATSGSTQRWTQSIPEGFPSSLQTDGHTVAISSSTASGASGTNGLTIINAATGAIISQKELGVNVYNAWPDGNSAVGGLLSTQAWYLPWTGAASNPIRRWDGLADTTADVGSIIGHYIWDICHSAEAVFSVSGDGANNWYLYFFSKNSTKTSLGSPVRMAVNSDGAGHGGANVGGKICTDGRLIFAVVGGDPASKPRVYAFPAATDGGNENFTELWSYTLNLPSGNIAEQFTNIRCDDRFVYVMVSDLLHIFRKETGAMVYELSYAGASNHKAPYAMGIDAERVWVGGGEGAAYQSVGSHSTARYSSVWRRLDPDPAAPFTKPENYRLWRKLITPIGSPEGT